MCSGQTTSWRFHSTRSADSIVSFETTSSVDLTLHCVMSRQNFFFPPLWVLQFDGKRQAQRCKIDRRRESAWEDYENQIQCCQVIYFPTIVLVSFAIYSRCTFHMRVSRYVSKSSSLEFESIVVIACILFINALFSSLVAPYIFSVIGPA